MDINIRHSGYYALKNSMVKDVCRPAIFGGGTGMARILWIYKEIVGCIS